MDAVGIGAAVCARVGGADANALLVDDCAAPMTAQYQCVQMITQIYAVIIMLYRSNVTLERQI